MKTAVRMLVRDGHDLPTLLFFRYRDGKITRQGETIFTVDKDAVRPFFNQEFKYEYRDRTYYIKLFDRDEGAQ